MKIAYPGVPGSYSHLAVSACQPRLSPLGRPDFVSVATAVVSGVAELGLLPVWNSIAGEVPGVMSTIRGHPELDMIDRVEQRIKHCLLALPGADIASLRWVESHPMALAQCSRWLSSTRVQPRSVADTAGAAMGIAQDRDWTRAAIASEEAAVRYGLEVLAHDIADSNDNVTAFVIIARNCDHRIEAA